MKVCPFRIVGVGNLPARVLDETKPLELDEACVKQYGCLKTKCAVYVWTPEKRGEMDDGYCGLRR